MYDPEVGFRLAINIYNCRMKHGCEKEVKCTVSACRRSCNRAYKFFKENAADMERQIRKRIRDEGPDSYLLETNLKSIEFAKKAGKCKTVEEFMEVFFNQ